MVSSIDLLTEKLRANNMSITSSRVRVFKVLEQLGPISMADLCDNLVKTTDRASVYRTIDLFEKLNIVQRLTFGWKYKLELSNEYQEHHHHLLCQLCGVLVSFHEHQKLEQQISDIAEKNGFALTSHQIELQGVCRECQQKT